MAPGEQDSDITKKRAAIITNNIHCGRHVQYFSTIEKYLRINGWVIADHFDVNKIIICSCGFHEAMVEKIKRTLEKIKQTNFLEKNIIMMGCLTKTHEAFLKRDFNGPIAALHREELLDNIIQANVPYKDIQPVNIFKNHCQQDSENQKEETFHIKISEGCLKQCTFCIINKAKGSIDSVPFKTIAQQVETAINRGIKRIHLMGEDTFAYGIDNHTTIIDLIQKITAMDPGLKLYFGYLHARWLKKYAKDIISLCKQGVITELQIGLQHVNEELLKRMGRPMVFSQIYDLICTIKRENPGFYLIADIMVGFPGETTEMFNQLVEFFKKDQCFNKVKHFAYSDVTGAPSANFKDKLPREVIAARWQELDGILGERSYSTETGEPRVDNETFRKTRFDDYFFCKDTFDEKINDAAVLKVTNVPGTPEKLVFAQSKIMEQDHGDFEF
jgi:ribosomal protein S12 methylthiotransferase